MNNLFNIKPELLKLTNLLKNVETLPSTLKLCQLLETTENKVRTMQKELLFFKFIYSQSSSGYIVNDWTKKLLNSEYKLKIDDDYYVFTNKNKSFIKFKIKLFTSVFKSKLDPNNDYDASILLYLFIIMSKSYKCIHENQIYSEDGKLILNIDVQQYITQINICTLQIRFTNTMQWKS